MKRFFLIVIIIFLNSSCKREVTQNDIQKINGYWEIEKVLLPNGNEKDYPINETFDYIVLKQNKGFRKKVTPQFNGSFLVNNSSESLEIKKVNKNYFIFYSTSLSKWKEEILTLSDSILVIINQDKYEYHYKRAKPLNFVPNGKKA